MFDLLKLDDQNLCNFLMGKNLNTSHQMTSPMIFVDNNIDYCEEMIYESDSVMIHADIVDNIEDGLLGINFMKHEDTHPLQYLNESNKIKFEDESTSHSVLVENDVQDEVVVEEVAEQEIISESIDWLSVNDETWAADKFKKLHFGGDSFSSSYSCSLCGHCFPERSLLLDHLFLIHQKVTAYQCHKCNDTFRKKRALINHIRLHNVVNRPISIEATKKKKVNNLNVNKKKRSNRFENCCLNDDYLKDSPRMQSHKRKYRRSNFPCSYCKRMYTNSTGLVEHMRTDHALYRDGFYCTYCGKRCKNFRGLQKHSTNHSNGELISCNTCSKQFCTRTRLRRHMLSHRDKAVICQDCGEKLVDHRALIHHRSSHHTPATRNGVLTTRIFPCYACKKIFGSKSSQQIHMRMHTGERPYSCRYCVKAFADGGTLRKHERIHTGEKPYMCLICRKAFNQRVVLREHIRVHHAGFNTITEKIFKCEVCHTICNSSQELCSHLVKHSDENTAKHRSPTKQPRKYKKWKNNGESTNKICVRKTSVNEKNKTSEISNEDSTPFYVLTDEEDHCDNNHENVLDTCKLKQKDDRSITELQRVKVYIEDIDNYSPFTDKIRKRNWKIENDEIINDVNVNYPLLSRSEECIETTDEGSNNVETCLNLISMPDNKNSDSYFNATDYTNYDSKNGLWFALKEKCEFSFDSDFSAHSGLGLGAMVELQSEF